MDIKNQIWAEIDLDAIKQNVKTIRSFTGSAMPIAVIKADAYGHGAVTVGKALKKCGIDFFAVSCLREAVEIRHSGIDCGILILGYTDPTNADILSKYDISQAVFSSGYAKALDKNLTPGNKIKAHIKLNTGMNRIGFNCTETELPTAEIEEVLSLSGIFFEGIFTHFAAADRSGDKSGKYTALQYSRFFGVCEKLASDGFKPKYRHCCNSAATLLNGDMHFDAVRPGIIIYGLTPDQDLTLPCKLIPALSFKATVSMLHTIKKGEKVSYGLTYTAKSERTLATITAGYADGFPRFLSIKGQVLIGSKRCNIVGKVCMDQTVVDVTGLKDVKAGDEVVLIGAQGDERITAEEIATVGGTINYEIICGISRRVPRVYFENKMVVSTSDYLG